MARVLQIRRGTTAQNNNFTGMPGELSFDTDAKTMRVHDGETLGGFALARIDQIRNSGGNNDYGLPGTDFDINDVPDEFWQEKVNQFLPDRFTIYTSSELKLQNIPALHFIVAHETLPLIVRVALICKTAEAGYTPGDEVTAFGIGDYTSPLINSYFDNNGLANTALMIGSQAFWVANKTTGLRSNITNDNWRIQFRLYC